MICPVCKKKFSYLKIHITFNNSKKIFPCPNCNAGLSLKFLPIGYFSQKDIFGFIVGISYILLIVVTNIFSRNPVILILSGPLLFVGVVYVMIKYVEKYGQITISGEDQNKK